MINNSYIKANAQSTGLRSFHCEVPSHHLLFIISLLSFIILFPSGVSAQQKFTEHLTRKVAGEGTVTLSQDAEIDALVNGSAAPVVRQQRTVQQPDTTAVVTDGEGHKNNISAHHTYAVGYRIQVYAGGNTRQSKSEAHRMGHLVRSYFNDVNVYTSFISPRWVCRVGDFKTREEAVEQLRKMHLTQQFGEASIVKSKIIVNY